jgi:FkbM family methyltransferase
MSKLFWRLVDGLLRWQWFRRRLASWVRQVQFRLGIGSGADPHEGGEVVALRILDQAPPPVAQRPLCIFDVGANRGDYTALVLEAIGHRRPLVHCFEPSPDTFALLRSTLGATTGVRLNQFALGRVAESRVLYADQPGSALASLTRRDLQHVGLTHDHGDRVDVKTIDAYCQDNGIDVIDLCKIDVEGHELDVLEGCRAMLARRAIRIVAFEFGGCNIDTRTYLRDFWYFFQDAGARALYRIMPGGRLFAIHRYDEGIEAFRTSNFIAVLDPDIDISSMVGRQF